MEIKTASNRMYSIIALYDLDTTFLPKAIEGISDKDAHNRLNTKANHVAWLTGSFVSERYEMAKALGVRQKNPTTLELFKDHKGIQDNVTYPSLAEFKKDLENISPQLRAAMSNMSDEKLNSQVDMPGPGPKMTFYELITFMTYRESNIIGQIALYRRLMGYDAINYM